MLQRTIAIATLTAGVVLVLCGAREWIAAPFHPWTSGVSGLFTGYMPETRDWTHSLKRWSVVLLCLGAAITAASVYIRRGSPVGYLILGASSLGLALSLSVFPRAFTQDRFSEHLYLAIGFPESVTPLIFLVMAVGLCAIAVSLYLNSAHVRRLMAHSGIDGPDSRAHLSAGAREIARLGVKLRSNISSPDFYARLLEGARAIALVRVDMVVHVAFWACSIGMVLFIIVFGSPFLSYYSARKVVDWGGCTPHGYSSSGSCPDGSFAEPFLVFTTEGVPIFLLPI